MISTTGTTWKTECWEEVHMILDSMNLWTKMRRKNDEKGIDDPRIC